MSDRREVEVGERRVAWALAALALLVYLPALGNGFVVDDHAAVQQHPIVTGAAPWWRVLDYDAFGHGLASPRTLGAFRPLLTLSLALDHRLGGGAALPFHLTNAALHAAVTATLFAVLRGARAGAYVSATAAALFAVHTLHTDAVLPIMQRGELLATLFSLLALATYHQGRRAAPVLGFALAIFSKESAVLLLPLFVLHDLAWRRRPTLRTAAVYAACAAVFAGFVALRVRACGSLQGFAADPMMNPLRTLSPWWQRVTAVRLVGHAARQLLAPMELTHEYYQGVFPLRPWLDGRLALGAATLVALPALAWRSRRVAPHVCFAALALGLSLASVCSVVGLYSVMYAERLLYLGSAAALVLAAEAAGWARARSRLVTPAVVLYGVALTALTLARCGEWRDDETILEATIERTPGSAWSLRALGVIRTHQGRLPEAVALCRAATRRAPGYAGAWGCLGTASAQRGDYDGAEHAFAQMVGGAWPESTDHDNYVRLLLLRGRPDAALAHLRWMAEHGLWSDAAEALRRQCLAVRPRR